MSRYIDADKIEYYRDCDGCHGCELGHCNDCTEEFVKTYRWDIDDIPTEDVAPVVHAEWIDFNWNDSGFYGCRWGIKCSNCLTKYKYGSEQVGKGNYCPNCGAKMRGE